MTDDLSDGNKTAGEESKKSDDGKSEVGGSENMTGVFFPSQLSLSDK